VVPDRSSAHRSPVQLKPVDHPELCSIRVFCGDCSCGCPELFLDPAADLPRRIVLADDFGQHVRMSVEQLEQLVTDAKSGLLDDLIQRAVRPGGHS
jgi:hypothetical protein